MFRLPYTSAPSPAAVIASGSISLSLGIIRRVLYYQPLMLKRAVAPAAPVLVHCPPEAGEHIKAVVKRAVACPMLRYFERSRHVPSTQHFGEVVPADAVPVAVTVSAPKLLRHLGQVLQVQGRGLEQEGVVLRLCEDEGIIVRILVLFGVRASLEVPVDEEPLDPGMTYAAGVVRQVHPLRNVVHASQTAAEEVEGALRELRRLVYENPVVFKAVVLVEALFSAPMAELDG